MKIKIKSVSEILKDMLSHSDHLIVNDVGCIYGVNVTLGLQTTPVVTDDMLKMCGHAVDAIAESAPNSNYIKQYRVGNYIFPENWVEVVSITLEELAKKPQGTKLYVSNTNPNPGPGDFRRYLHSVVLSGVDFPVLVYANGATPWSACIKSYTGEYMYFTLAEDDE